MKEDGVERVGSYMFRRRTTMFWASVEGLAGGCEGGREVTEDSWFFERGFTVWVSVCDAMEVEEAGPSGAVEAVTAQKKRFEVKKYNAVALWAWGE